MSKKNLIILLTAIIVVHLAVIYGCMVSSRQENPGNRAALEAILSRLFDSGSKDENLPEEKTSAEKSKPWIYSKNPQLPAQLQNRVTKTKSVILVDLNSRKVIYERNSKNRVAVASLTKLMSLLVINDHLDKQPSLRNQIIELSPAARQVENAKLRAGKYKFDDLRHAMIVGSYNDAATQLAITCSGSVEAFVAEMNQKAADMGLNHAKFNTPSGLPLKGENSYASAADIALLCEAVMKNAEMSKICSTARYTLTMGGKRRGGNTIGSDNLMINGRNVPGAFGFKTGFTNEAGQCVAFGIRRNGRVLIGVVTGAPSGGRSNKKGPLFETSIQLAEWAFKNTGAEK